MLVGARGWVAGRAGFWGALATWIGVSSCSPMIWQFVDTMIVGSSDKEWL